MKRTRNSIQRLRFGLVAIVAALVASPLLAATEFGVRTGVYTDASAGFVGGEVLTSISHSWYFNPNLEYAINGDRNILTVNGDVHYDFFNDRPYNVWAGAGPALIHRENVTDSTDLGVNLLGGIGWKTASKVAPYVQGKVTVAGTDEAVLAVGMRF